MRLLLYYLLKRKIVKWQNIIKKNTKDKLYYIKNLDYFYTRTGYIMTEQIQHYCKVCNTVIHPKRVQLGYKDTCVNHSETKKFMGLIVTEGKESEEVSSIQVIRNPKMMEELDRLRPPSSMTDIY